MDTENIENIDKLKEIRERSEKLEEFMSGNIKSLTENLSKELPTGTDPQSIAQLKSMATYAEAKAMTIGSWLRALSVFIIEAEQVFANEYYKEQRATNSKATLAGCERYIKSGVGVAKTYEKQLEQVQDIIKRRVLLAQTMIKSAGTETTTVLSNDNRIFN